MFRIVVPRVLLAGALALLAPGLAGAQPTTRVSVGAGGAQADLFSLYPAISADGRWVAFYSAADNLVAGDTNGSFDTFLYDRQARTTTRVSVGPGGAQASRATLLFDGPGSPAISADGRWVAFVSSADNLVPGDTNGASDVFVYDRQTGATTRVSVGPGGAQANTDAFYLAASRTSISADGRWVAFESPASNLVPGDTNGSDDVFVHDIQTGTTTRVSMGPAGTQGNAPSTSAAISADGRWVTFRSLASNLVAGDTNGSNDVFVHDRQTATTTRVSVSSAGAQGNNNSTSPAISADGRWVTFQSLASNLVAGDTNGSYDVFVHDRQTATTTCISVGPGGAEGINHSTSPAISADGRFVSFVSLATNLVPGGDVASSDAFVHDRQTGTTTRMSESSGGAPGNDGSEYATISADGRWVAFHSLASNLVTADTNNTIDVFLRDRGDPVCFAALAPLSASPGQPGGTGSVAVTTGAGCAWSAVSNDPTWLSVTGGVSGTGSGSVSFSVAANPTTFARTGTLTIAGQWFTVTQVGVCVYRLDRTATGAAAAGGQGSVTVTTSAWCAWTAASSDPGWLTVTSGSSGTGTGTVSYTVAAEPSPGTRTATLTVGGRTFTVTQVARTLNTAIVSVGPGGVLGNHHSPAVSAPSISAEGRWVAFDSFASNLVPDDRNSGGPGFPTSDVFVYDRQTATTTRVSVGPGGAEGNIDSFSPAISADGRWVAFTSFAINLVAGDTNGVADVFVHDRQTATTTRVSVGPGGAQGNNGSELPAISADGRWIAFISFASNLVAGDTNGAPDVFVQDRQSGTTTRVSVGPGGAGANGDSELTAISADGRWVTFDSSASNLVAGDTNGQFDVFLHDLQTGTTTRVSVGSGGAEGNGGSGSPAISADGRWVAFASNASNLVAGDTNGVTDVFLYDRQTGTTTRVSKGAAGAQGNADSENPAISADGRWVAFESSASNLVAGDTNGRADVFVYDRQTDTTTRVTEGTGAPGDGGSVLPSLSADGAWIAFASANSTLVPDDGNGRTDVFVFDRLATARGIFLSGDLSFGNVPAGATATRTLTISNAGNHSLTVSSISYPPGFSGVWSGAVPAGGFQDVIVTFAPTAAASYGGTITVNADQTSGTNTIAVSGAGTAVLTRAITVSGNLAFGSVPAGATATRTLTIGNNGNSALTVTSLTYPAAFSGAFSGTIAAGASQTVTVTFAPTAPTTYGGIVIVNADQTNGFTTLFASGAGTSAPVTLSASPGALNYGAIKASGGTLGATTPSQRVRVTQSGSGAVTWTATPDQPWLQINPQSGTGSGTFTVSVTATAGPLPPGPVSGSITVHATGVQNSPVIPVSLTLYAPSTSVAPHGVVDTPPNGTTGVTGSIAVTGWAIDDIGVARVRVLREPIAGEGTGLVFIGDAVLVDGARPDVAAAFPTAPLNTRAGWGYLMLTNFLPNGGNGTFVIHAIADDLDGHSIELGTTTITCTNATATAPFGAIDTPGQGETVSGANYANFGWVLGHTPSLAYPPFGAVRVLVDGTFQSGSPLGWVARPDLTSLFPVVSYPGVANALGVYGLDTTALANGVHTIAWIVTADNGKTSGIGSRFFSVANGTGTSLVADGSTAPRASLAGPQSLSIAAPAEIAPIARDEADSAPLSWAPIIGRRGADPLAPYRGFAASASGRVTVQSEELDRVELLLAADASATPRDQYAGFVRVGGVLEPLPIGSRLDPATGIFTWQPGVGFLHAYDFVFVRASGGRAAARHEVRIVLNPKASNRVGPQVVVDIPSAQSGEIPQPFAVGGWAIDDDAGIGTGVTTVHVWAYPREGPPIFLGPATYGGSRPDVAAIFGQRFRESGFGLTVSALPPGTYELAVFAWSSAAGGFLPATVVRVMVR